MFQRARDCSVMLINSSSSGNAKTWLKGKPALATSVVRSLLSSVPSNEFALSRAVGAKASGWQEAFGWAATCGLEIAIRLPFELAFGF